MTLSARPAPFEAGGSLFAQYLAGGGTPDAAGPAASLLDLFDYPPSMDGAAARAAALASESSSDRAALAAALVALNERLGAPEAALAAARTLADSRALAVVTGQQAGVLTGPIYTLYKAAGAVALARRLTRELGRPVVPVFWAATEDHDLAEADHTWLLRPDESWQRLRYRPAVPVEGASVGAVPLTAPERDALLDGLKRALPAGRASGEAVALAAATGEASATLGEWFCRLIAALCGPLGVVVVDPMDPALRRLAADGVGTLIERAAELSEGLAAGEAALTCRGFVPQLTVTATDAQLFYYPEGPTGPRRALSRVAQGGFALRDGGEGQWAPAELRDLALRAPERFSGNVVTRPLLQDALLPTVAYVAGPGEIAYYAMLGPCYRALDRTMPLIWPRPSYTIVEPAVARLLRKRNLADPELPADLDRATEAAIGATDSLGIEELFAGVRRGIDAAYQPAMPAMAAFDEVLGRLAVTNRDRIHREVEWLRKKSWQVARQRAVVALGQLDRLRTHLWPSDGPQERTVSGLYYLALYGLGLTAELAAIEPGPPFGHQYLYLG